MNLKETKKFQLVKPGASVRIYTRKSWFKPEGIVETVKGINGYCYRVFFTNGQSAYLTWSSIVEIV